MPQITPSEMLEWLSEIAANPTVVYKPRPSPHWKPELEPVLEDTCQTA